MNFSLRPFNTFGLRASAAAWLKVETPEDYVRFLENGASGFPVRMVLGGGSNVLFAGDYPGLMLKAAIAGTRVLEEDEDQVWVEAGAGVTWHDWVMECVSKGWGGIENLSLIPGQAGAAPIQNIGAYGVELRDVFVHLDAMHLDSGEIRRFHHADCAFGYRDSVFKGPEKGKWMILRVVLKLSKKPQLHTAYGAIEAELAGIPADKRSIRDVSEAVIRIRRSKLPDPAEIGNSGSFFKNPVIPTGQYEALLSKWPDLPGYPAVEGFTKVPAGWLIDRAGWKGRRFGDAGVHAQQALVLVNYGEATGREIYDLSCRILEDIQEKYGIHLEREVNIIGLEDA